MLPLLWLASTGTAKAVLIDPNFMVCNSPDLGNAASCSLDPNPIHAAGSFYAGVAGGAGSGPLDPFLLLVAAPSQDLSQVTGAAFAAGSNVYSGTHSGDAVGVAAATSAQYGGNSPGAGGYLGQFTTGSLYDFAGLSGGNSSFSWSNMADPAGTGNGLAEQSLLGYTPGSFSNTR